MAHDGRQLYGHVVDLGSTNHFEHSLESFVGLTFAQDGFAQNVDVQRNVVAPTSLEVLLQRRIFVGEDQVLRQATNLLGDDIDNRRRCQSGTGGEQPKTGGVEGAKTFDGRLGRRPAKDVDRTLDRVDSHDFVGQRNCDLESARVAKQSRESSTIGFLRVAA